MGEPVDRNILEYGHENPTVIIKNKTIMKSIASLLNTSLDTLPYTLPDTHIHTVIDYLKEIQTAVQY